MPLPFSGFRALVAAVVAFGLCYLLWAWSVPGTLSTSTFTVIATLLGGMVLVTLFTWKNAQATSSMGQLLHDTEGTDPRQAK